MTLMSEHDPNADHRVEEVEHLRQRIRALEEENTHLVMRSAFMKQRLDELESILRGADPTCSSEEPGEFPNPDESKDDDAASD
jgi:regulator of replication initiation timing